MSWGKGFSRKSLLLNKAKVKNKILLQFHLHSNLNILILFGENPVGFHEIIVYHSFLMGTKGSDNKKCERRILEMDFLTKM